jgi:hypothetical protein
VKTLNGVPMLSDDALSFFVLSADGDGSRQVGIEDFNLLAQNFGKSAQAFGQGNYDYSSDGKITINDFNLLAANFGKHLDAPTTPSAAAPRAFLQTAPAGPKSPAFSDDLLEDSGLI